MDDSSSSDSDYEYTDNSDNEVTEMEIERRQIQKLSAPLPKNVWTNTEKRQLFNALADYGSSNIKLLSRHIPTKNFEQVRNFVLVYQRRGRSKLKEYHTIRSAHAVKTIREAPIDAWINYTIKSMTDGSHKCMLLSRALKYIALFEGETGFTNVKLKNCYEVLSACLEGQAPRYLNRESSAFLVDHVQKLVKEIRYGKHPEQEMFLNGPKRSANVKCYRGKKEEKKIAGSSIFDDVSINPLKVPEKLLHM